MIDTIEKIYQEVKHLGFYFWNEGEGVFREIGISKNLEEFGFKPALNIVLKLLWYNKFVIEIIDLSNYGHEIVYRFSSKSINETTEKFFEIFDMYKENKKYTQMILF